MKNRWKHIFIPVLAMALCLSLAACGNSDDVAGEDWRTTGVAERHAAVHAASSLGLLLLPGEPDVKFVKVIHALQRRDVHTGLALVIHKSCDLAHIVSPPYFFCTA